ncbi:MAG: O-antigen ligase family protein [Planctomycetota bacterium]
MSKVLVLGIIVTVLFVAAAIIWPTVGLLGYMSISLIKAPLTLYVPWLFGFWGYVLDLGIACVAILGVGRSYLSNRRHGEIFVPHGIWVCLIVLIVWIWIRLPGTRDPELGMIKTLVFSIFDTVVIILGFLLGRTQTGLRQMTRALILVGIIAVIGVLIFGRPEQEWEGARTTFGYATALAPADMAAYLVIALTGFWLAKRTFISMAAMFVAAVFATGTIFVTGTRGPFLTLAPAFLVMIYLYRRQVNLKAVIAVILFIGITIFAFKYYLSISRGVVTERFGLYEIQKGLMDRVDMIRISMRGWASSPILGTGPGGFNVQMEGVIATRYPHNLVLEVANELGLIGLIPYLVMLYYGLRSIKVLSGPESDHSEFKTYAAIIFGGFIYHFIASFKTGSYAGSHMFYLFWGATIGMAALGSCEYMQLQEYYGEDDNEAPGSVITEWDQE